MTKASTTFTTTDTFGDAISVITQVDSIELRVAEYGSFCGADLVPETAREIAAALLEAADFYERSNS